MQCHISEATMKSTPLISNPVALGLFAVAASQAFDFAATLAMERETAVVGLRHAIVEAAAIRNDPEIDQNGVGRTVSAQAVRIVGPFGKPLIHLLGARPGTLLEMHTHDGEYVLSMLAGREGDFFHTVMGEEDAALRLRSSSSGSSSLRLASPDGESHMGLLLKPDEAGFGWSSRLASDERFRITASYSLTGGFSEMRDILPGQLFFQVDGPRGSAPLAEYSLYSASGLEQAIEKAVAVGHEPEDPGPDARPETDFPPTRENTP